MTQAYSEKNLNAPIRSRTLDLPTIVYSRVHVSSLNSAVPNPNWMILFPLRVHCRMHTQTFEDPVIEFWVYCHWWLTHPDLQVHS